MKEGDTGTRLDGAFQAAMNCQVAADAIARKEALDASVKEGGDPLGSWVEQSMSALSFAHPPPDDVLDETSDKEVLTVMRAATVAWAEALKAHMEQPTVSTGNAVSDSFARTMKSKAALDAWRRAKEMDECRRGEGDPFYCWREFHIWIFPWPQPPPPDTLEATTPAHAWSLTHSAALDLLGAVDEAIAAGGFPG